ncbi:hypothetical protein ANCCAN_05630 [Ancylostoma caninum]|uniref:Uncharacterized protein n=1 Tax=Ancylostoma caninum TaxID=29170 RepID=A0A368GVF8_ANCCA|nr:hypothetical protein ANCCAN_05630 [Ancylostoma caninum]
MMSRLCWTLAVAPPPSTPVSHRPLNRRHRYDPPLSIRGCRHSRRWMCRDYSSTLRPHRSPLSRLLRLPTAVYSPFHRRTIEKCLVNHRKPVITSLWVWLRLFLGN